MMISYAQNGEDVLLQRALAETEEGFYVDVGAAHPESDSVTKHFYDKGWHGINVEPARRFVGLLNEARPRDLNLEVALSNTDGVMTFYDGPDEDGWSTLSSEVADSLRSRQVEIREREVEVTTLAHLCEKHVTGPIDFLKIDVEGHEREVIEGADWEKWRPRILAVEATFPHTAVANHEDWDQLLIDANYRFALFDGINRFYIREEDAALLQRFDAPANYLDDFIPFRLWEVQRALVEKEATLRSMEQRLIATDAKLADALSQLVESGKRLEAALETTAAARDRLVTTEAALSDATLMLEALRAAAGAPEARSGTPESLGWTKPGAASLRSLRRRLSNPSRTVT